jgi:hypothetical protein
MSWFIVNSTQSFSFKPTGGSQTVKKFDPENPETALVALENKVKTKCPTDRRSELLLEAKRFLETPVDPMVHCIFPHGVIVPDWYKTQTDPHKINRALVAGMDVLELHDQFVKDKLVEHNQEYLDKIKRLDEDLGLVRITSYQCAAEEFKREKEKLENTIRTMELKHIKEKEELKETYKALTTKQEVTKSCDLGTVGQNLMTDLFNDAYGINEDIEVSECATESAMMDYDIKYKSLNIKADVKNWAYTVSKPEVDKCKRDMEVNPHVDIGILISLKTNISLHSSSWIDIEPYGPNRFIIYINNLMEDPITRLKTLVPFFRVIEKQKRARLEDTTDFAEIVRITDCIKAILKHHGDAIGAHRKAWTNKRNAISRALKEFDECLGVLKMSTEKSIEDMLKVLNTECEHTEVRDDIADTLIKINWET